jgi:hypothetical protein
MEHPAQKARRQRGKQSEESECSEDGHPGGDELAAADGWNPESIETQRERLTDGHCFGQDGQGESSDDEHGEVNLEHQYGGSRSELGEQSGHEGPQA